MLKNLNDLVRYSQNLPKARLVVAMGNDKEVIEAVEMAKNLNVITPILVGPKKEIIAMLNNPNDYQIIDAQTSEEAAEIAVAMIKNNEADFLMKGLLDTKVLLKAVVNRETGIRDGKLLSHVALFSFPSLDHLLFASDCAMIISPTLEEKEAIIKNVVDVMITLGFKKAKVGIVSAVEKVNPKIPTTVEAKDLIEKFKENENLILDGPFAIDNLVSMESVIHKGIVSDVAGVADALIFPNLEAGNIFYKTSVFLAGAEVCGFIVGAKCPIVLTSRADSHQAKLNSILLAMVYNYGKNNLSN